LGPPDPPWDVDIDVHVSFTDLVFLRNFYNMSVYDFDFELTGEGAGREGYWLDINPFGLLRTLSEPQEDGVKEGDENVINARWISTQTGLFVDITALKQFQEPQPQRRTDEKHFLKAQDGHEYAADDVFPLRKEILRGMDVYVPNQAEKILASEYGEEALRMRVYRGYVLYEVLVSSDW
jgi:hypothetical protein